MILMDLCLTVRMKCWVSFIYVILKINTNSLLINMLYLLKTYYFSTLLEFMILRKNIESVIRLILTNSECISSQIVIKNKIFNQNVKDSGNHYHLYQSMKS